MTRALPSLGLRFVRGRKGSSSTTIATDSEDSGSLADELPYLFCGNYLGFGPLHLLADDTLGFAFTLEVPTVDTMPEAEELVSRSLATLLHALPTGVHWQWFLVADPHVEDELRLYESQLGQDDASILFAEAFLKRWRGAQARGFFPEDPELNFYPRSQRILVALKSPSLGLASPTLREFVASVAPRAWREGHGLLASWLNSGLGAQVKAQEFIAGARDVLAAAHGAGWTASPVDADALASWVALLLFPQRRAARESAPWVEMGPGLASLYNELRTAIASQGCLDEIAAAGFRSVARGAQRHHRAVSMLWQPRGVRPGLLNELALTRPHLSICLTAAALPATATLLQLKARALLNARSTHRFNATEMDARAQALQEVEQRLFAEGERLFELRMQIHLCEETAQEADEAARLVCKHLESFEVECAVESDIGSALLLRGCLPFAVYPETEAKLRRRRRFLTHDCADLHPAGGSWTGIRPDEADRPGRRPSPVVMYSNPLGEPLFIDPTKAEKNPHALVVGQSGSGKSFFVHDYLLHLWRLPDVRLFLISIKADYRKLALVLGRYLEISLDADVSLNPFAGRPTLENQARWFAALTLMLSEGNEAAQEPSREAQTALQEAALTAAQRNWDSTGDRPIGETVLEDVCKELERGYGPVGRELALQLHPYRRGPYRRLFNRPRDVQASDRFVFFNLGSILRQPCAALASFCVFGLIDDVMNDPQLRGVPKGLVADEVWALVRNPHAAAILERSLKAYRSLGGFALPIVQDPQDLDTPSGRVMLVNTATKIILPLDRAGQNDLTRYVKLNERELEIVRNLQLVKRRYSEFFVAMDGMRSAKGILIPDALRYAIATTDPADEEEIERHFQETGNMLQAVRRFAAATPFGLRTSRANQAAQA